MTNPVFKTFYNHRIFLIYHPDAYRNYLLGMVDQNSWQESERFGLTLGLMAWGTILVYQSRLVPFDFNRRLKALVDANGAFLNQNPTLPMSRSLYRQQLAMQLGIEVITRERDVKERIEETPIFAQYIYDTLYLLSFYHDRGTRELIPEGQSKFAVTRDDLRTHLWYRTKGDVNGKPRNPNGKPRDPNAKPPVPDAKRPDPDAKPPPDFVSPEIAEYLFEVLKRYMQLLLKPENIRKDTRTYASQLPPADRRLWLALADAVDSQPLLNFEVESRSAASVASNT
jgi:hypothetical protein